MIDITKKYKTRDGRPVRILCVDAPGKYQVVGIIEGTEFPTTWTTEGMITINLPTPELDLVEDKPKLRVERWVNLYKYWDDDFIYHEWHTTAQLAKDTPPIERTTIIAHAVPFVWEEGEES